jgi:hypothetical protein
VREEGPGHPGEGSRQAEGEDLEPGRGDAHALGGDLVFSDGLDRLAGAGVDHVGDPHRGHEDQAPRDVVLAGGGAEGEAGHAGLGDARDAQRSPGDG